MPRKHYTVADSKYADELIKLDFPENLITTAEDCKMYVDHCNKYNMKFLKGSYGTIVHQKFDKYFKGSNSNKMKEKLMDIENGYGQTIDFDHSNLFKSKIDKQVYMLTASPYGYLNIRDTINALKNYPYDVYVINPNFVDYHGFLHRLDVPMRHPLFDVNYAYTNASISQWREIEQKIFHEIEVFPIFSKI